LICCTWMGDILMIHKRGHDMGKHDVGRRRGLYRRVVVRRRRSSFVVVRRMYVVDVPIKKPDHSLSVLYGCKAIRLPNLGL
jgi:hypothetical protein